MATVQDASETSPARERPRTIEIVATWSCRAGLVLLPVLLTLIAFYRPVLDGAPLPSLHGDGAFYAYQFSRGGELGGRWWELADDPRLGSPYQSEMAKHPGLFEGVDLMLTSVISGRVLDPTQNYHFLMILMLAINGWIAAFLVYRLTGSYLWAAVAVSLITLHYQMNRIVVHSHLIKFGWFLLAVYAFARYLHAPTLRRGALLGLAVAWAFQGSFYLGYLMTLGLGTWWVGCLLAGRLDRRHVAATCVAGATCVLAATALLFPVWSIAKQKIFSDEYFHRSNKDILFFSAELWQYFTTPYAEGTAAYIAESGHKPGPVYWESWNFPGYTVLLAIALYSVARLRGVRPCKADPQFLDLAMGLIAVLVVLSLSGGPGFFLFHWIPSFRCYGRAGLLALALGTVVAPVILHGLSEALRPRWLRFLVPLVILPLVVGDARIGVRHFAWHPAPEERPAWVDWLAKQPPGVRLAAFNPPGPYNITSWGLNNLDYLATHRHTVLNGCDYRLLQGDLKLLGTSYERINPAGLRLCVTLGYEALAFHRQYLDLNPWIGQSPWLDRIETRGDWVICRANRRMPRFPTEGLEHLLASQPEAKAAVEVPARRWITGQLEVPGDVVINHRSRALLAWEDAGGKLVGKPTPAFIQHVFGPSIPAFTVKTPKDPGGYRLVFFDAHRRRLASKLYRVQSELKTGRNALGAQPTALAVSTRTTAHSSGDPNPLRLVVENPGPCYIQTHASRETVAPSARSQPGILESEAGSVQLTVRLAEATNDRPAQELVLLLPQDMPPHGRLEIPMPVDRLPGAGDANRVAVTPAPTGVK